MLRWRQYGASKTSVPFTIDKEKLLLIHDEDRGNPFFQNVSLLFCPENGSRTFL
jgi:hypothetical protein